MYASILNLILIQNLIKMSTTNQHSKNESTSDYAVCLGGGCICISVLAIIAGAVAYIVFGIMYLVQDYNLAHSCDDSALWAYVLTAIILSLTRGNAKNAGKDKDGETGTAICTCICMGFIEGGLAIWGGIELWQKSCDDLTGSNIWKFGLATFVLQTFCATLFLVILPMTLCCCTMCEKSTEVDHSVIQKQTTPSTDISSLSYQTPNPYPSAYESHV